MKENCAYILPISELGYGESPVGIEYASMALWSETIERGLFEGIIK